jgi:hypothetical protein
MPTTAKQQLLELTYGGDLASDIAAWLAAGRSWRQIRSEVEARTNVRVSYETLRQWYSPAEAA